jgi:hypothetical protein
VQHLSYLQIFFKIPGLWPSVSGSTFFPVQPLIQKWFPRYLLAVSVYFTTTSPIASYERRNESIVDCLEPLSFCFFTSTIFIHVYCLLYRGERFERVFRTLHEMRACAAKYSLRPKAVRVRAKLYTDLVLLYVIQLAGAGAFAVFVGFPILITTRKFLFG